MISPEDEPNHEDEAGELNPRSEPRRLGFGAAMCLYGVLAVLSVLTLTGNFRIFMLVVLGAITVMTYTHRLREKLGIKKRSKWDP